MARASGRTTHEDAHDDGGSKAASTPNADGNDGESLASNDEEAIRAKLRESGWEKKTRKEKDDGDAPSARKTSDAKDSDRDHDRERRRGSGGSSARKERRSRSRHRGGERERDDRRDRDRDSRRHRDRSAKRGKPSSRRRSSRSRSNSKSRSRSASKSRRVSSSHHKRRGASRSRSVSRGRSSGSKKSRAHASKSRSPSPETSQKKKKKDDADTDTDPEVDVQRSKSVEQDKANEKAARGAEKDTAEDMDVDEEAGKKPIESKEGEKSKERASSAQRKGRKSSRHSRSKSRSPSRSSRRRRHRSRSRSPSRNSRRRRSSRSRSRSRGRRGSDRRRRRSYTRSRSPSHSRRRRRSSSKDKKRRDANSSPEPHEHPPGVPVALPIPAPVVNPTITQLMQQYPAMSLQDIIAKMQASNVTMAAAVSQKPARELYVGNLPPNVTGPQLQEFLGTIIQQVGLCAQPGNPILNTWISTEGHFAFCEMRSVEECNLALLLNQLSLLGQPLKFGRPRSFMGPPQPMPVVSSRTQTALVNLGCTPNPVWFASPSLGATGFGAPPALPILSMPAAPLPNPYLANPVLAPTAPAPISAALLSSLPADANSKRLLMSNIPVVLVESQVKELVEPFGELKSLTLLMDKITGASTGNALFEYEDDSVAEEALQGLNGLDIGGIPLSVRRAPQDANGLLPADETSVVVKLANMVSLDELKDDEEFSDLKEDVEEECKRFGKVVDMVIPRPQDGTSVPGVGNIYVRFNEKPEAASAMKALSGRKFGGNIVKVTYYPLPKFESKEFA